MITADEDPRGVFRDTAGSGSDEFSLGASLSSSSSASTWRTKSSSWVVLTFASPLGQAAGGRPLLRLVGLLTLVGFSGQAGTGAGRVVESSSASS